ncbi:Rid family hydrolase [Salininema proteolyticum]|uniref:Rid family hydrolase n=1 Tax=Salininema proteolyticum TaxID=1607685 RepID=A0ABV8TW72_9ACTN
MGAPRKRNRKSAKKPVRRKPSPGEGPHNFLPAPKDRYLLDPFHDSVYGPQGPVTDWMADAADELLADYSVAGEESLSAAEETTGRWIAERLAENLGDDVDASTVHLFHELLVDAVVPEVGRFAAAPGRSRVLYCTAAVLRGFVPKFCVPDLDRALREALPLMPDYDRKFLPHWVDESWEHDGGPVYAMVSEYGDEFALAARFVNPARGEEHAYLVHIDHSNYGHVTHAREYDFLEDAFEAARARAVFEAPRQVESSEQLHFLDQVNDPFDWADPHGLAELYEDHFRSQARVHLVLESLRARGITVPDSRRAEAARPDVEELLARFAEEFEAPAGLAEPDSLPYLIAERWITGPPGTELSISPKRCQMAAACLCEFDASHAPAALRVLPQWIRFCAAETGAARELLDATLAFLPDSTEEVRRRDREAYGHKSLALRGTGHRFGSVTNTLTRSLIQRTDTWGKGAIMTILKRVEETGPWADLYGYAKAVGVGPLVLTSACAADVVTDPTILEDPPAQAREAFRLALDAVVDAGAGIADVVRSRIYLIDPSHADPVGRVHGEMFGVVKPVATVVSVAQLMMPGQLVAVELEAFRAWREK